MFLRVEILTEYESHDYRIYLFATRQKNKQNEKLNATEMLPLIYIYYYLKTSTRPVPCPHNVGQHSVNSVGDQHTW